MNLRSKILCGYGIALFLLLTVLGWAIVNYLALGRASDAILRENYHSILAASRMLEAVQRQEVAVIQSPGTTAAETGAFERDETDFLQWLGRARDNVTIPGEEAIIDRLEDGYGRFLTARRQLLAHRDSPAAAREELERDLAAAADQVKRAADELHQTNEATMKEASRQARQVAGRAVWSTVIVGLLAVAVGLVFSLMLSSRLVRPLHRIMGATQEIAAGRYDTRVAVETADELGQLAREFNTMADRLQTFHNLNIERLVSEKQKSEAILESIDDGLVVMTPELCVSDLNRAASKMLAVNPVEVKDRHVLEVVRDDALCAALRQTAETGKAPQLTDEQCILTVGEPGSSRHLHFAITPVRAPDDHLVGVVLLLRDVTRLKELDRLKTEFVMAASHELRTPLTSLGMSIDLLLEQADHHTATEKELLQAAHEEIERLKALVTDLLDLSRIEAGRIEMEFERVPVATPIEQVLQVFAEQARQKAIDLSVAIIDDLPEVRADANKIAWVLTNLIANAFRYLPEQGGKVTIVAGQLGHFVEVGVRDNGSGIAVDQQSRIFDKFVQVGSSDRRGGSGLGLAISKEIIRAHGGSIWVESAPGHGSTFLFTLPIHTS